MRKVIGMNDLKKIINEAVNEYGSYGFTGIPYRQDVMDAGFDVMVNGNEAARDLAQPLINDVYDYYGYDGINPLDASAQRAAEPATQWFRDHHSGAAGGGGVDPSGGAGVDPSGGVGVDPSGGAGVDPSGVSGDIITRITAGLAKFVCMHPYFTAVTAGLMIIAGTAIGRKLYNSSRRGAIKDAHKFMDLCEKYGDDPVNVITIIKSGNIYMSRKHDKSQQNWLHGE